MLTFLVIKDEPLIDLMVKERNVKNSITVATGNTNIFQPKLVIWSVIF